MKYIITKEYIFYENRKLFRIKAMKSFYNENGEIYIKKGDLGGYIEHYKNLSQFGNSWVGELAKVYGKAKIKDNAIILGNATISQKAKILENACVFGRTDIKSNAIIKGNSFIGLRATIGKNAETIDYNSVFQLNLTGNGLYFTIYRSKNKKYLIQVSSFGKPKSIEELEKEITSKTNRNEKTRLYNIKIIDFIKETIKHFK